MKTKIYLYCSSCLPRVCGEVASAFVGFETDPQVQMKPTEASQGFIEVTWDTSTKMSDILGQIEDALLEAEVNHLVTGVSICRYP